MEISNVDGTDYNVDATVEVLEGVNTENLAYTVVLTETDLESPGSEIQIQNELTFPRLWNKHENQYLSYPVRRIIAGSSVVCRYLFLKRIE